MEEAIYLLRRYSPVLFQSSDVIQAACPVRFMAGSPDSISYNMISLESPAAAKYLPCGEKATVRTGEAPDMPEREYRIRLVSLLNT